MTLPPIEAQPDGSAHGASLSHPLQVDRAKVVAAFYSPDAYQNLLARAKEAGITAEEQQAIDLDAIVSW
jgi:hypothetical protein